MANYFVRRQSKVFGPVIGQQIVALAKSGKIHPTDEIATDKNGPWQPATSIGPLQAAFRESSIDLQPLGISSLSSFQPNTQQTIPPGHQELGLAESQQRKPERVGANKANPFLVFGILGVVLGAILVVYALTMNTTVSTGLGAVHNVGLMGTQRNFILVGGFLFLGGIGLICMSRINSVAGPRRNRFDWSQVFHVRPQFWRFFWICLVVLFGFTILLVMLMRNN